MGAARAPVAASGIWPACRARVSKPNLRSAIVPISIRVSPILARSHTSPRACSGLESGSERLGLRFRGCGRRLVLLCRARPAVFRRRYADLVQEEAREVALRGEAELGRHLRDLAAPGG